MRATARPCDVTTKLSPPTTSLKLRENPRFASDAGMVFSMGQTGVVISTTTGQLPKLAKPSWGTRHARLSADAAFVRLCADQLLLEFRQPRIGRSASNARAPWSCPPMCRRGPVTRHTFGDRGERVQQVAGGPGKPAPLRQLPVPVRSRLGSIAPIRPGPILTDGQPRQPPRPVTPPSRPPNKKPTSEPQYSPAAEHHPASPDHQTPHAPRTAPAPRAPSQNTGSATPHPPASSENSTTAGSDYR